MPATQGTINLLDQNGPTNSPWNRLVVWITTYGRYIMITTELVVLLAFASRFSLDRKLTDLKENISQKQEILEVNVDVEKEIRDTQDKIVAIKQILQGEGTTVDALMAVNTLLPTGTALDSLSIDNDKIMANVTADSSESFSQFLANFSVSKKLTGVEIGKVSKKTSGIQFSVTAKILPPPKPNK